MLPSNIVIGVDQDPIVPIKNCVSIQEDIHSAKCIKLIEKGLKNWKADVVLCDGAPHYGPDFKVEQIMQSILRFFLNFDFSR